MAFIKTGKSGKIISEIKTDKDGNIKTEASINKKSNEKDGRVPVQPDKEKESN